MTEPSNANAFADDFDPAASSLTGSVDPAVMAELLYIRSSIDNFDATLVYLLAERFKATQRVGFLKAAHHLPPADPNREKAQIHRLRALAESAHLDPAFAEKFMNFVISEVIHHHQAISQSHSELTASGIVPVVSRDGQGFVAPDESAGSVGPAAPDDSNASDE